MLLFRSEEHVARWGAARGLSDTGQALSLEQIWNLARRWYGDRLDPAWRRRSPEEAQRVFDGIGLTGAFWRLLPG